MKFLQQFGWIAIGLLGLGMSENHQLAAQQANYDEAKVPEYQLPALLRTLDDQAVTSAAGWQGGRRAEIFELFRAHVYGQSLPTPGTINGTVIDPENTRRGLSGIGVDSELIFDWTVETAAGVLGGKADRKQVRLILKRGGREHAIDMLIYLPSRRQSAVPLLIGLNFLGNQTIANDPAIRLTESWVQAGKGVEDNRATEKTRGLRSSRWPVETILARGFGLATIYYGDIDPDFDDQFRNGIHGLYPGELDNSKQSSIAAWSWGLSRAMDYLQADADIDAQRVAVLGHSRLGKTALWAGACDQRFAVVISNNSGCGGAALSRRCFGETVGRINQVFPHWFCDQFGAYNGREQDCPVDQHMLVALMAPRPVYVASASEDRWADPKGEFLAAREAQSVYALFDRPEREKFLPDEMPEVGKSVGGPVGYHVRAGKHDLTEFDWQRFMDFIERNAP